MATQYKTPGVYIQEPNSFPPSIVGVETAVPCFIGYTEKAVDIDNRDLKLTPRRIESMAEFVRIFGGAYTEKYYLVAGDNARTYDASGAPQVVANIPVTDQIWGTVRLDGKTPFTLVEVGTMNFNLYNSMRLFYANGGGACYIVSLGGYKTPAKADFLAGVAACGAIIGPTMVLAPDAVELSHDDAKDVNVQMLKMCEGTGDRMAILDVWGADTAPAADWTSVITNFRTDMVGAGPEAMKYGAAYFPPLVTSVVSADEVDISNFVTDDTTKLNALKQALGTALAASYPPDPTPAASGGADAANGDAAGSGAPKLNAKGTTIYNTYVAVIAAPGAAATTTTTTARGNANANAAPAAPALTTAQLTQALVATVPSFQQLLVAIAKTQSVLPASGAMAGLWTTNDNVRGVWNAPANTGIAMLVQPKLPITGHQQDDLNVPVQGLAVNAIRTFQGRGTLVWGARTLDSNSNDWRYIQVRRTMIYVEQSVKQALEAMVFRPNTAQTWVTVTSMIESFLHGLWAAGGLMGASPAEAFKVQAGLGSTMTPDDVLNGIMRVQITLQMVHPAEFIELTFKQQMLGGS